MAEAYDAVKKDYFKEVKALTDKYVEQGMKRNHDDRAVAYSFALGSLESLLAHILTRSPEAAQIFDRFHSSK